MKLGYSTYLPKGKLERFNNKGIFLKNVREVIRESLLLKQKGEFTKDRLKKIFPQSKWRYNPFQWIRVTALINPEDYVVIMDILEEKTGDVWGFDEVIKMLIKKYIEENEQVLTTKKTKSLKLFEKRFKKYYKNIMVSWRD